MSAEALLRFSTATLHEAAGGTGALAAAIKPLWPGARMAGRARTVATAPGDNLALHRMLPALEPGDVLVADGGGAIDVALWGDVMTQAALAMGAVGLVVDGAVRDVAAIAASGFAVFARGVAIPGPSKRHQGTLDLAILCGGMSVALGDWVMGDADGVVVIPAARIDAVLAAAKARDDSEAAMMARLRTRQTTTLEELGLVAR